MHLVEHETALAGTPSAFEITWSRCACGDVAEHEPGRVTLDKFAIEESTLAVPAAA